MPPGPDECLKLSITKLFLFATITMFVLYLPLGDPQTYCNNFNCFQDPIALCCLCDAHDFVSQMATKTLYTFDFLSCKLMDFLYEMKLKENEETGIKRYSSVRSSCKCKTKCCRRGA
ncbi:uncharacterized protein LOC131848662 isoform X2 [Achroia grisella]|uniref:uncharacterized protein LOC131848662 isoform X2 n=1 Tax=Achroia grisella TaxID=688607 RepID=UPI0027D2354A|nr:uncharacterized protein LOC131848662 isoform X2 [Achroia grisella]